jgi:hypothetical protein
MEGTHFVLQILKKGNHNTKHLAYTALIRPILEYGAACWDPHRVGQVSALNRVQARAAKFANNTDQIAWKHYLSVDWYPGYVLSSRHTLGIWLGKL